MRQFSNPIPRSGLPRFHESHSHTDAVQKLWQKSKTHGQQLATGAQNVEQVQRQLNRLRLQKLVQVPRSRNMFPFKIYNFPKNMRKFVNDNDWQRVKVRGGYSDIGGSPPGSDGAVPPWGDGLLFEDTNEQLPNDASVNVAGQWHEVVVPLQTSTQIYGWEMLYSLVVPTAGHLGIANNVNPAGLVLSKLADDGLSRASTILETGESYTDTKNLHIGNTPYVKRIGSMAAYPEDWAFGDSVRKQLFIYQETDNLDGLVQIDLPNDGATGLFTFGLSNNMRFMGQWASLTETEYYFGDIVYVDKSEAKDWGGAGNVTYRYLYIYWPNQISAYWPNTLLGPLNDEVDPSTNSPDPWLLISRSKMP